MAKLLSGVVGLIGVFWLAIVGAYGVVWYDHNFQGYRFSGVPLVHWFAFTLPPGASLLLAQDHDPRLKGSLAWQLAVSKGDVDQLTSGLIRQNASMTAQSLADAAALGRSEHVVAQYAQAMQANGKLLAALSAPLAPAPECVQYEEVHTRLLESLK